MQLVKWLVLAAAAFAAAAHAQSRLIPIPADAKPGTLRHVQGPMVELDGKSAWLSPGAQIRDAFNRLVLPTTMVEKTTVKYLSDGNGMVHRVWILTPEEVAQIPKPPAKKDAKKDEKKDDQKAKD